MQTVKIDVYHLGDKPRNYAKLRRSWDGTIYLEVGVQGPILDVGAPPAGPDQPFCFQRNRLQRCSEVAAGGRTLVYMHQPIIINEAIHKELLRCNS